MSISKTKSLYTVASFMAISGVLTHCLHVEGLMAKNELFTDAKTEKLISSQHTHVETNSYSSTTFGMRTQPPAARPQDDDDRDMILKKRISCDCFGNDCSSWAI